MESLLDFHTAKALLDWQIELGATEAMCDAPMNRYEVPDKQAKPAPVAAPAPLQEAEVDAVSAARQTAQFCNDINALQDALGRFDHCELKRGARNLVFCDGNPQARVMIIGEAPGRDEDREGRPFVGRAGQLLDRMLAAIDLGREVQAIENAVYITNVLPWRPPQNRDPKPEEIAMLVPFVERHVELVDPQMIVLMGNISCQAGLGRRGITRLRGTWATAYDRPALPMFHPAYLLRKPQYKREAWADLLELKARLGANT